MTVIVLFPFTVLIIVLVIILVTVLVTVSFMTLGDDVELENVMVIASAWMAGEQNIPIINNSKVIVPTRLG